MTTGGGNISYELTESEIENWLEYAPKMINENYLKWERDASRGIFKLKVKVDTTGNFSVRLIAEYNPRIDKLKCALLVNNVRVRCLEYGKTISHKNPDGTLIRDLHKHRWTDKYGDKEAYVPTDIDTSSPEKAFYDFLKECNIVFKGRISKIPVVTKQERIEGI